MGKFTLFRVTSAHIATIEYPNDGDQIIHSVDIHNLSVYKKKAKLVFPQIKNLISKNHSKNSKIAFERDSREASQK